MNIFGKHIVGLTLTVGLWICTGCTDDTPDSVPSVLPDSSVRDAIQVDAEESFIALPTTIDLTSVSIQKGDFLTLTKDGQLYFERNDGNLSRVATLVYRNNEGDSDTLTYAQTPACRAGNSPLRQFYRHHGIGYSYNAINGSYCNLRDFRCQILNRAVIDRVSDENALTLLNINAINHVEQESSVYSSVVEYIAEANIDASASGSLAFFSGSASTTCAIFEDGIKDTYILHNELSSLVAEYSLAYRDVCLLAKSYPELLTSSFRAALDRITDQRSIDDFIYTYGTHVVVFSRLGASMLLDVQVDAIKFKSREFEETLAADNIALLFKEATSSTSYEVGYKTLENSKCQFQVMGGDVSLFDPLIGFSCFNNSNIPEQLGTKWLASIKYDDEQLDTSNVELVDIHVVPIWEFIPDESLAAKVRARITGDMSLAMEWIPNRNFINTSFEAHPSSVTCRIGNQNNLRFDHPETVDIIAANRHVATICHEYVPEISTTEKVYVAYPIYEGRIKLTSGLCLYNGKAYKVDWRYDNFQVSELEVEASEIGDRIYINGGVLSPIKSSFITYQESHAILGCERPGGIGIDGSLAGEMKKVFKHLGHFYLDTKSIYQNLPGWEISNHLPQEAGRYPDFFKGNEFTGRMVRSDDYVYIFNPTEIGY